MRNESAPEQGAVSGEIKLLRELGARRREDSLRCYTGRTRLGLAMTTASHMKSADTVIPTEAIDARSLAGQSRRNATS